jgi:hypothetical protein
MKTKIVWSALLASNLLAAIILSLTVYFAGKEAAPTLYTSEFVVVPILMGIISAWFFRKAPLKIKHKLLYALYCTLLALAVSAIFAKEGIICLAIVSPLIYSFILIGLYLGQLMFRKKNNTVNFSIAGCLAMLIILDLISPHKFERAITDVVQIKAPASVVWKYVAEYEPIQDKPDFWLFKIGMPCPVNSTVSAHAKGAGRKCIFSNGYVFDEIMTEYKPDEELTFEITSQPRDPEIMGHIDIEKGQFLLKQNADGSTALTGTSWYRLHVFPSWYYDLWASSITRNVHLRVMQQIKKLSETEAGNI